MTTASELVFLVEEAPEGGYTACALGVDIFTEGETMEEIKRNVLDAVRCHFDSEQGRPKVVRLHLVKDEILPV